MSAAGINAYKNNSVTTQTPGQIIVLLYDGATKFLRQALTEMEAGNYVQKGNLINRAIDIICELNAALDMEAGGDISMNLRKLYLFMHSHLVKANFNKDPKMIQEVIGILDELNQSWRQIQAA